MSDVENEPTEAPPAYHRAVGAESRPLPEGWIRELDETRHRHYYVDTEAEPPRSIWHHPYDDTEYLSSLSAEERDQVEESDEAWKASQKAKAVPPKASPPIDLPAREVKKPATPATTASLAATQATHNAAASRSLARPTPPPTTSPATRTTGRKFKDKMTGTTHEMREADRQAKARQQQERYSQQAKMRAAMTQAINTGEPAYIGQDAQGHNVYVEPPPNSGPYGSNGITPHAQEIYRDPNTRFVQPPQGYGNMGGGYGGGYNNGYGQQQRTGPSPGMAAAEGFMGGMILGAII